MPIDLTDQAYERGLCATRRLGRNEQKALGQFMTPAAAARFVARRCVSPLDGDTVTVLDPAAGTGVLAAAVFESLLERTCPPRNIEIVLYEIDERLSPELRSLVDRMRRKARSVGVTVSASIRIADFLLSPLARERGAFADVIIANPPYFKVGARDPRAVAHPYAVHGQPNIYGLFMAACAGLLKPGGRWAFITPRSWTNGAYFAAVRRHLCRMLRFDSMHLFESRSDHFTDDEILQEAMITWATAQSDALPDVIVSSSRGVADLADAHLERFPLSRIVGQDETRTIVLPVSASMGAATAWDATLERYVLKVSTGPIVAFRAREFLREQPSESTVPLLWMQHVSHMNVRWPLAKKREHVVANARSAWMLVPNSTFVLLRRFSPKEDERRITAAPYFAKQLPGSMLGLENHTNYIHRPGGSLADDEAAGLAAFLNSRLADECLRSVAGNTQINATDLRRLPLPPHDAIRSIGARLLGRSFDLEAADAAVAEVLGHPFQSRRAA